MKKGREKAESGKMKAEPSPLGVKTISNLPPTVEQPSGFRFQV
jgi:hypothetical protein